MFLKLPFTWITAKKDSLLYDFLLGWANGKSWQKTGKREENEVRVLMTSAPSLLGHVEPAVAQPKITALLEAAYAHTPFSFLSLIHPSPHALRPGGSRGSAVLRQVTAVHVQFPSIPSILCVLGRIMSPEKMLKP